MRILPNVVITGIPATGKTTLSAAVAEKVNEALLTIFPSEKVKMTHINVSKLVEERKVYHDFDEKLDATVFYSEDLWEELKTLELEKGGYIVDFHDVMFEELTWIDKIFVLETTTEVAYDRMKERNYSDVKIQNNISALIFQSIQGDIESCFGIESQIMIQLSNNDMQQFDYNVNFIKEWILSDIAKSSRQEHSLMK